MTSSTNLTIFQPQTQPSNNHDILTQIKEAFHTYRDLQKKTLDTAHQLGDLLLSASKQIPHGELRSFYRSIGLKERRAQDFKDIARNWDIVEKWMRSNTHASAYLDITSALQIIRSSRRPRLGSSKKTNRSELLQLLESVSPGLNAKETVQQSQCFVFRDGRVHTFNDEIAVSAPCFLPITGAVKAQPLLRLLRNLPQTSFEFTVEETEVEVKTKTETKVETKTELVLSTKNSSARFPINEIYMPLDAVDFPGDWHDLPADFWDAAAFVTPCATKEESEFVLTCVHITDEFLEATDRFHARRHKIETGMGELLIRGDGLLKAKHFGFTQFSSTPTFLHFRNDAGLVMSLRDFDMPYRDIGEDFDTKGTVKLKLPPTKQLRATIEDLNVFSESNIGGSNLDIKLKENEATLIGRGEDGNREEKLPCGYTDHPIRFQIAPELLRRLAMFSDEVLVGNCRLIAEDGPRTLLAVIGVDAYGPSAKDFRNEKRKEKKAKAAAREERIKALFAELFDAAADDSSFQLEGNHAYQELIGLVNTHEIERRIDWREIEAKGELRLSTKLQRIRKRELEKLLAKLERHQQEIPQQQVELSRTQHAAERLRRGIEQEAREAKARVVNRIRKRQGKAPLQLDWLTVGF